MIRKKTNPLLFMGLLGSLTVGTAFVVNLVQLCEMNEDMWWTPSFETLNLKEGCEHFRLAVSNRPFEELIEKGNLKARSDNGEWYNVVARDVSVRLNNRETVRASIYRGLTITGIMLGAVLTLLIIGAIQRFKKR